MADFISREAAIEVAERYGLPKGTALGRHLGIADCIALKISYIPAADVEPVRHGRWIPCCERTPEDADFFPVVIDDDIHGIIKGYAYWSGEYWTPIYTDLKLTDDVLYWMPLPEPPEDGGNGNAAD